MIAEAPTPPSKAHPRRTTLGVHIFASALVASGSAVTIATDKWAGFWAAAVLGAILSLTALAVDTE